ncbi:hypothetical protein [Allosphingosinicella vermicomposti]|uniref:hypothetical protein n=1 Tax=Allosphingosinicella vermicomposti TaxID=614671 RepID=UPI000D11206D|nr:hypothetical protein [Allosphingosinicella vermicomposti]
MTIGAERAGAHSLTSEDTTEIGQWDAVNEDAVSSGGMWDMPIADMEQPAPGRPILGGLLILLAIAWTSAAIWSILSTAPAADLPAIVGWIGTIAGPLVLIALMWLIFGRTPRREAERFTQAVTKMRAESAALDGLLAVVTTRLEDNYARMTAESAKLMTLGDEAADRLGRVTHYIAKETETLDRKAEALEAAANAARVDIGILLQDLPRAEDQARTLASALHEAGVSAHEQAGALDAQVSSLVTRGREAEDVVGGAAQRLAAHLARIEGSIGAAADRLDQAAGGLGMTVDDSLARASEALDATRSGLDAQGQATLTMIEKSAVALDKAGSDAARSLSRRIETLAAQLDSLAAQLSGHDDNSQAIAARIGRELELLEERHAALASGGLDDAARYQEALTEMRATVQALHEEMGSSVQRADGLVHRTQILAAAVNGLGHTMGEALPEFLTRIEAQTSRAREAAGTLQPQVETIVATSNVAGERMAAMEEALVRQQNLLHDLLDRLERITGNVGDLDGNARRLIAETGPELVDALIRVRETANQAAASAREAIATVIPESAAALGQAGVEAVRASVAPHLAAQMAELNDAAKRSAEAARIASERLTRQIVTIGETTAAIEARITEAREEQERSDSDTFSHRVALLIDALNSAAIDVSKLLSNEVSDTAWAAYLKGDRGAFTRRAVKLLSSGEAREIGRHYENDPEFREQVNRYVHDFEAMLRRLLSDRDGQALSVTMLSSDMGKLYVALAQAIERLRA